MINKHYQIDIDDMLFNIAVYRWEVDDFVFIDFNKSAEKTENVSRAHLIGKKLLSIFPAVKEFGLYDVLLRVYKSGKSEELDSSLYEDKHIYGWRKNSISKLSNGDVMAIYEDLSKIKELELSNIRFQEQLETAQKLAHLGSWEWDIPNNIFIWSDEVFRIFGEVPQNFQVNMQLLLQYIPKNERKLVNKTITEAIKNKSTYEIVHQIIRKDKSIAYVKEIGNAYYNNQDEAIRMIGTIHDITELKLHDIAEQEQINKLKHFQEALLAWSKVDYQDLSLTIKSACEISARTMYVGRVSIWLYNEDKSSLNCLNLFELDTNSHSNSLILKDSEYPHYFESLKQGNPLIINKAQSDIRTSDFTKDYLKPLSITSMLDVPIMSNGKAIGIVCNEHLKTDRNWDHHEVEFSNAMARSISLALEIEKRQESEEKFRLIAENSLMGIFIYQQRYVYFNDAYTQMTGYTLNDLKDKEVWDIVKEPMKEKVRIAAQGRLQGKKFSQHYDDVNILTKSGEYKTFRVMTQTIHLSGGYAGLGTMIDITDIKKTKKKLNILAQAVEQTDDLIRIVELDGNISYVNDSFIAHTGYINHELIGKNSKILKSGKHTQSFYEELWQTLLSGNVFKCRFINRKKDKTLYYEEATITPILDEKQVIQNFVVTGKDITEKIALETELKIRASTDELTGLYNRHKGNDILNIEIERSNRYGGVFSILFFDIDHFKRVNDTYGHDVGDRVLEAISQLVKLHTRKSDAIIRWGGEEFIILLLNLNQAQVISFAEKLRKTIEIHSFNTVEDITISIGISSFKQGDTKETLIKRADTALYKAKDTGRNRVITSE
ncbi:MAG: hypothetical protein COA44_03700 [Arcobacter sp.]|nr:MAG: hypothetical protein COA44_03700 [Arcobacter sp.]